MNYERELKFALLAAQKAAEYINSDISEIAVEKYKGSSKDFATEHDIAVDQIISYILKTEYPDDIILTEETVDNFQYNPEKRVWIIDPIDGTRNFANGLSHYSISIALWEKGDIVLGVIHAPKLNEVYYATKGQGAFFQEKPLTTSLKESELESSLVLTGFSYFQGEELDQMLSFAKKVLSASTDILRLGSASLDTATVTLGKAGAYYEKGVKIWDIAAAFIISKEAGINISDFAGNELDISNPSNYKIESFLATKNDSIKSHMIKLLSNEN